MPDFLTTRNKSAYPKSTSVVHQLVSNPNDRFAIGYFLLCQMNSKVEDFNEISCNVCKEQEKIEAFMKRRHSLADEDDVSQESAFASSNYEK